MAWSSGKGKDSGNASKHYGGHVETTRDSSGRVVSRVSAGERGYVHQTRTGKTTGHSNGVSHHHGSHRENAGREYTRSSGGGFISGIFRAFFGKGGGGDNY